MANSKWIKWTAGMAGVVMFTGFVGYISKFNPADTAAGNVASTSPIFGAEQDDSSGDVENQWRDEASGGDAGFSGQERGFMGGRSRSGMDFGSGQSSSGKGSMRTHAS
ncbi:hypothetical protein [Paenibacillus sp. Y412MC10]|uniref:hypothetical protein n=1 Tax=Geobacillus sp. (strain Y412MC10) TaxID=481743 RepID=UPI0011A10B0D|nr:hypothetical protein [Paenibacillus sp. Y412MC10]